MQLTELKIAPRHSYAFGKESNPTICTVKLASETATVETVLSDEDLRRILDLVQIIVAEAADRNVRAFVAAVRQIEAAKTMALA